MLGRLINGGTFVLVSRGGLYSGEAYIRGEIIFGIL